MHARLSTASLAAALLTISVPSLRAQDSEQAQVPWSQTCAELGLTAGAVNVDKAPATIELPDGWHYIRTKGARQLVEEIWGNPPDKTTLGVITPPRFESDDRGTPTWAIIVSYNDDGHIKDDDAGSIDYDELLTDLQKDTSAGNSARVKAGYEPIELVAWAEDPTYDAETKQLYWAKHLRFGEGDAALDALNYDIRVLGRRGTLVLQAVGDMEQLDEISAGAKTLLPTIMFKSGETYSDFKPGVDAVVVGGIGALVAGKLLLKGGILKLLAGLIKPILVGLVALGALLWRMVGGKKSRPDDADDAAVAS